ncbi:MAG: hypothetical protein WC444_04535 [Candidatus Paceibacterota bacterium]
MKILILEDSANAVGWNNIKAALPNAIKAPNLWEYFDEVFRMLKLP